MFNLVEKIDEWFMEGHTFAEGNNHKPSSPERLNPYPNGSTESLWWDRGYQNSHRMYIFSMTITLEQLKEALAELGKEPRFQGSELKNHNARLLKMLGKMLVTDEALAIAESNRKSVKSLISPSFEVEGEST